MPQNNNNNTNKNKLVTNYRTTGKKRKKNTSREEVGEAESEIGGKNRRGLDAKLICAFIKFSGFFRVVQGRRASGGESEWPVAIVKGVRKTGRGGGR